MKSIGIVWAQFGPYHFARAAALQRLVGAENAVAFEIANRTSVYAWKRPGVEVNLITLCPGSVFEEASLPAVFWSARRELSKSGISVCLIPGYYPLQLLAVLLAAKSLGIKTVMMNEGHAGTARARGLVALVKRRLVGLFDAALVGGEPQKRYAAALGIPSHKIFTGYDAVDNDYFVQMASQIRSREPAHLDTRAKRESSPSPREERAGRGPGRGAALKHTKDDTITPLPNPLPIRPSWGEGTRLQHPSVRESSCAQPELRSQYELPAHYFLSLGRFVAKKNLTTLIRAYHQFLQNNSRRQTHLVMVGSGEEETNLRALCGELQLPVYEKSQAGTAKSACSSSAGDAESQPGVHFYGFRQIDENPIFYALAEAFVLPSSFEEWGLVVNEAMACGLPVIVSQKVGCAEDLLVRGKWDVEPGDECARDIEILRLAGQMRVNGISFDPDSIEELGHALLLLDSHPELRDTLGANSRRIIAGYSCDNFARNALLAVGAALGEKFEQPAKMTARILQAEPTSTSR